MTSISSFHTSHNNIEEQIEALERLVNVCLKHQGGGTYPIIDFLLGLYNGHTWRPDMQLLSGRIDDGHFEDVINVMRLYRETRVEPHTFFTDGENLFRELASYSHPVKLDDMPSNS